MFRNSNGEKFIIKVNESIGTGEKEKNKTKYWFVKNMEGGYQSLSHLIDNQTSAIRFETLEKLCNILECDPGDILILKKKKTSGK